MNLFISKITYTQAIGLVDNSADNSSYYLHQRGEQYQFNITMDFVAFLKKAVKSFQKMSALQVQMIKIYLSIVYGVRYQWYTCFTTSFDKICQLFKGLKINLVVTVVNIEYTISFQLFFCVHCNYSIG